MRTATRTLRAEWIKLRSLRSTWYTVACLFVVGLGITGLSMSAKEQEYRTATATEQQAWDPTNLSLTTYIVAQLIIGVLGILVVTSEYATGSMLATLGATPRRHRLLAAKMVLATAVAVVAGQALMFGSFFLGQAMLAAQDVPNASLGDPGVFSAVVGGGVYLSAIALLAAGLGTIMRATAGALTTLVGIVFLVPALGSILPSWLQGLLYFWPTQGAASVLTTVPDPAFAHPWLNLGGMCLGVAAVVAVAFAVFRRRDV
ncbi:ABC-type transport system involved in multi-copper enzyme maturation permease subunit [Kibdelosporangium banguiense]|uniref:ABC-type transport system involved in multi-copper enzyme maturation permease subunit n=1 Tax=Kibdelosporangium banguiense TaxID=1365924 RepID=A0ABS4TR90_9PSEU|nr:ABC transporter permease subunit [Kibdelosporangium banguiense]MBP2326499.1 ABC-type transport system involved in multi-copper enzyme maturation permease subunit [Kibdelosporangium banguiense]